MNLCCQLNTGFECIRCGEQFCADCWMLVNKAYFQLEGGLPIEECLCPSEELARHVVHHINNDVQADFSRRWADIMDEELTKGNRFWEYEDLWKRAAKKLK